MKYLMPDGELKEHPKLPDWKTPWNHDTNFESERTGIYCPEESKTKQEFKDDADINVILARFMKTGQPPDIVLPEHFADLTGRTTYFDMASKAADANELFYLLPATKRAEFLNDPTRWADAVVAALARGDVKDLNAMGVAATEKPQEAPQGDSGDSPARKTAPGAPGASKTGDTPEPPSDTAKK